MNKLLIVDDNQQILRLLSVSLKKAGYEIVTADDGSTGLEVFKAENPDLIISDIMMPRMDGIEFCLKIREGDVNPLIPFIFMTSLDSSDMEVKGYRAGADDYIRKPVERDELIGRIEKLLSRQQKVEKISAATEEAGVGLKGDLKEITIVEIIQLISLNHRSGVLKMDDGNKKANLYFEKGNIIRIDGDFGEGEEALPEIVGVNQGIFGFEAIFDLESIEKNISGPTMHLLMEACRLFDEDQL
jgi:CheY-like chemotaxis protein